MIKEEREAFTRTVVAEKAVSTHLATLWKDGIILSTRISDPNLTIADIHVLDRNHAGDARERSLDPIIHIRGHRLSRQEMTDLVKSGFDETLLEIQAHAATEPTVEPLTSMEAQKRRQKQCDEAEALDKQSLVCKREHDAVFNVYVPTQARLQYLMTSVADSRSFFQAHELDDAAVTVSRV